MPKSTKLQKKIISPTVEIPQIEIDEESSSDSETEVVSKIEKPKKPRTEKQIAALAKMREVRSSNLAAKRELIKIADSKMEKIITEKVKRKNEREKKIEKKLEVLKVDTDSDDEPPPIIKKKVKKQKIIYVDSDDEEVSKPEKSIVIINKMSGNKKPTLVPPRVIPIFC